MTSTIERPPACRYCAGQTRLILLAYGDCTAVHPCSTCERAYTGSSLSPAPRRPVFAHPLLQHRTAGAIIGFIGDARTDGQGWMRRTVLPVST